MVLNSTMTYNTCKTYIAQIFVCVFVCIYMYIKYIWMCTCLEVYHIVYVLTYICTGCTPLSNEHIICICFYLCINVQSLAKYIQIDTGLAVSWNPFLKLGQHFVCICMYLCMYTHTNMQKNRQNTKTVWVGNLLSNYSNQYVLYAFGTYFVNNLTVCTHMQYVHIHYKKS